MSQIICQRKDKTLDHYIKHPSKGSMHTDVILLHRKLCPNLNRHVGHSMALKTSDFGVVYIKCQLALDKRRNVLGSLGPLKSA